MCYPPPGPRCSSHSHKEWLKALSALDKEEDNNKRLRLQRRVDEARRIFNSTPRGQNRLLREMGVLEDTPENHDKRVELSLQLRDGQLTRENQMTAFLALKSTQETNIKALLKTSNKQEQAVGVAFHVLMQFLPEEEADNAHILPNNIIQIKDAKILCLPQKHQRLFATVKEENDGYLSSAELPGEILDIFADFADIATITPNHVPALVKWFVSQLQKQGVQHLAVVDVKTENIVWDSVDNLLRHFDASFTQKSKLGGTSPYLHGETDLLKSAMQGTPLEGCSITVAVVKGQKRTYILDAPHLELNQKHSEGFYFAENATSEGSRFYEVKVRHQSSQIEVFLRLTRRLPVISRSDETALKRFIFDNFTDTGAVVE